MNTTTLKKIAVLVPGLICMGLGGSLFILSNIGADTFSLFLQGLSKQLNITIGQGNIAVNSIYAILICFLDKKYIKIGTLIAVFTIGPVIDLSMSILRPVFEQDMHFIIRLGSMLFGNILIAFGIAVVYSAKIGMPPNDAIPIILAQKADLPFKWVRISYDFTMVAIGIAMGGVFGIGTIICVFITGPLIAFFMPPVEMATAKMIGTYSPLS